MTGKQSKPGSDADLDLEALREVEAAVTHLAERYHSRDPKIAAALEHEVHTLRELLSGRAPARAGVRGSLDRLRAVCDSVYAGGLYEEAKDASLLILLNRLLGV